MDGLVGWSLGETAFDLDYVTRPNLIYNYYELTGRGI